MKSLFLFATFLIALLPQQVFPQASNLSCSNPLAESIMMGNYAPGTFFNQTEVSSTANIASAMLQQIQTDSLKAWMIELARFRNRNSGSDTNSSVTGIGAARRWVHHKFSQWSQQEGRVLIPSYFNFTQSICGIGQHRNIMAVIPGTDTSDHSIVLIEGHFDSRCEGLCDTACLAQGVEDNASGTALTMELARAMSALRFRRTIVFLITTAEEQGLYGAEAFADYVQNKGIGVRAVLNNDVIGGIICGATASPPGCSGINSIDSMQVRLFSSGGFNSKHKQFARFVKLQYEENLKPLSPVKMLVSIMSPEDRTGRGGDHIPFRQHGYTAIRFTSANEHGNANVSLSSYSDRQHSTRDTLGVDMDGNAVIDSFFVDFNYLARNSRINGMAAAIAASGPAIPDNFITSISDSGRIFIQLPESGLFRIGIRTLSNDWDSVYTLSGSSDSLWVPPATRYYVSVAALNADGMESLFSKEIMLNNTSVNEIKKSEGPELLPNKPNPFDEATLISVFTGPKRFWKKAELRISDANGKTIKEIPLELHEGINEVLYEHGYQQQGVFYCTLLLDGKKWKTMKMLFSN
jgi:hypothetical protein